MSFGIRCVRQGRPRLEAITDKRSYALQVPEVRSEQPFIFEYPLVPSVYSDRQLAPDAKIDAAASAEDRLHVGPWGAGAAEIPSAYFAANPRDTTPTSQIRPKPRH